MPNLAVGVESMMRGRIASLGTLAVFFSCFGLALVNSSSVVRQSIPVPFRIPQVAAGVPVDVEVETGVHSILGLAHCDSGLLYPLRFQPADGSEAWEFRCSTSRWGDEIKYTPEAPGRDGPQHRQLVRIDGRLLAAGSSPPGPLRGKLAGQVLAPIHIRARQFETRVLEIEKEFDVLVVHADEFRANQRKRAALFWIAAVLGLAALIAHVAIAERRKRPATNAL